MRKLLQPADNEAVLALLAHSPFPRAQPPKFVRALIFDYRFAYEAPHDAVDATAPGQPAARGHGRWYWRREFIGQYGPTLSLPTTASATARR